MHEHDSIWNVDARLGDNTPPLRLQEATIIRHRTRPAPARRPKRGGGVIVVAALVAIWVLLAAAPGLERTEVNPAAARDGTELIQEESRSSRGAISVTRSRTSALLGSGSMRIVPGCSRAVQA